MSPERGSSTPTGSREAVDTRETSVAAGQAPVVTARDGEARNFEIEPKQRTLYGKSVRRLLGKTLAWAAHTVVLPVRGVAYLQGRWKVFTRIRDVFQNDAGTLAIHPMGAYSTAFGATLGARAFYKDFGGNAERITELARSPAVGSVARCASLR
jgi:hypothetical protein